MKKALPAALVLALAFFLVACGAKKPESSALPSEPSSHSTETAAPVINTNYAADIDSLLADYEKVVDQYLADMSASADTTADESSLGDVSSKLSDLAKDFSVDQLAKYNAITAKLSGE